MTLFTISYKSETLHKNTTINVLIPANSKPDTSLKVLWALHGMTDDHTGWIRRSSIELYAEKYGICVVMPNADLSFYIDMVYGADYFTYITEELPRFLSQYLPISLARKDNFIVGNSMGGYGAYYIAMNCPDQYMAAVSLSGPMRIDWINQILSDAELADVFSSCDETRIVEKVKIVAKQYGIPKPLVYSLMEMGDACTTRIFKAMFGVNPDLSGNQYDLFHMLKINSKQESNLRLLAYCGKQDYHYSSNELFQNRVAKQNADYTFHTGDGSHNWFYWNECIPRFMFELFES